MPLEWSDYVKLALASSAVSSVIALAHSSWKDGRAHKRDARDSALTAALVLEQYARDCRSMMYKASPAAEEAARTQSYDPVEDIGLPQFQFPGEIEWKWLNHKNAVALREFPAMLLSARRFLGATYEFEDPVIYAEELEFQCAKAAKKALELAAQARRKNGVSKWEPEGGDAELGDELNRLVTDMEASREVFYERQAKMHKEMLA